MKKLRFEWLIIVALAAITITFCYLFFAQKDLIREERERVAALEQNLQEKESEIEDYVAIVRNLKKKRSSAYKESEELRIEMGLLKAKVRELEEQLASAESKMQLAALDEEAAFEEEGADTETEKLVPDMKGIGKLAGKMMKIPGMKKMIREQQRVQLDMMYGDLYKKLWLSEENLTAFKELLLDRQMSMVELGLEFLDGEMDKEKQKEVDKKVKEAQEEIDEEVRDFLGDEKFEKYQEYNNTITERIILSQYKQQLAATQIDALTDYQENQLIQAMKDERVNFPASEDYGDPTNPKPPMFSKEMIDSYLRNKEEYNKRIIEKTGQLLTEEQLDQFKTALKNQLDMEKLGMEMASKMFGSGEKSPAAVTAADTATEATE